MSVLYVAGFDRAQQNVSLTVVVAGPGAGTATVATTGTFCHISLAAVAAVAGYVDFASAVQTALNAVVAGWTVSYSSATNRYTIAHATPFTLTWTGDAGVRLRAMLGFAGNVSSTTSAVGTVDPLYSMVPTIQARSLVSDPYEPEDIVEEMSAEDDTTFAVSKQRGSSGFTYTDQIMWADWTQAMEPKSSVYVASATTSWTWERFFKSCRGEHPFVLIDGASTTVHMLRAKGASFGDRVRTRVVVDYDDLWSIRFETRQLVGTP